MTELSKLIGFSLLLLASSAQAERAVMERSTMSAGSFIIFPDNTKQYTAGISSGQVTGDNLGNHTATQTLDLDFNNIANANRIGVGNVIVDYSGSVIEYTRTPTFPLDVLGNSAIQQGSQIYAKELVSLSSSSTLSPYIVETSVDCSGTGVCGVSNAAGIASENGSYWGFYGGAGDSVILSIRYVGFSVPNGSSVIGAEGYIKKYSNNPTALTGTICKMFYPTASTEIGINQCESNDWSLTASTSVYGNSGYSWGVALATTQVNSDDFGWGLHISLSGNATAYIDVVKMRLFYASDPIFKAGYSDQSLTLDYNGEASLYVSTYSSVGIMKQPAPPYELDVNGDINFSGSLYQNGVEFVGGGGGGDNLGSHIATQTLVMGGYSIQSSSSIRANEFFGSGSGLTGVITSTAVIVSDLDSLESIVATMGASTASLAGYIDSVVNNDIPRIDAALSTAVYTTNSYANPSWITSLSTSKIDLSTVTAAIASAGGGGGNSWVEQNFYAQTNGTQAQFTLSQEPVPNSLRLSKNGVVQVAPADYSLSGQVITMVSAPASSTTLLANYAVSDSTVGITISSNTWTARQTFTGSVTVSSFTATGGVDFKNATMNNGGKLRQYISSSTVMYACYSAAAQPAMPFDGTIPQITEGSGVPNRVDITPANATSNLHISGVIQVGENGNTCSCGAVAIFKDGGAGAVYVSGFSVALGGVTTPVSIPIEYTVPAVNTNARYYEVRIGCDAAGGLCLNGSNTASWGGVSQSTLRIEELAP